MIIDITSYYLLGIEVNIIFKPWALIYFAFYYCKRIRKPISRKNYLIFTSIAIALMGDFLFPFQSYIFVIVALLLVYLIEHQLWISVFREEKVKISGDMSVKSLIWAIPLVLFCFLYFGSFMMPKIPDNFLFLSILYCVQIVILTLFAAKRNNQPKKSYFLVLAGIVILILSDTLSSVRLFLNEFPFDYAFIRVSYVVSKVLLLSGMFYSVNHLDREYK